MTEPGSITIHVLGDPQGQPRGRAFVGPGGHARIHEDGSAEGWKSAVAEIMIPRLPGEPWLGAIRIRMDWLFDRPKSHFGTGRNAGFLKPSAPVFKTSKPDTDNAEKAILDCLTRLRLWRDDAQVAWVKKIKWYCPIGVRPGMVLTIWEIAMIGEVGPQDHSDARREILERLADADRAQD